MRIVFTKGTAKAVVNNSQCELGAVEIDSNDALLGSLLESNINKNLIFTGDVFPETEKEFYLISEGKLPLKQTHTDKYLLYLAEKLSKLGYENEILAE